MWTNIIIIIIITVFVTTKTTFILRAKMYYYKKSKKNWLNSWVDNSAYCYILRIQDDFHKTGNSNDEPSDNNTESMLWTH